MKFSFSGIQQVGIGVHDAEKAWEWYAKNFDFDVQVFNDEAQAALMTKYTGNSIHNRKAILALNMLGGGGFEIWQFTSRTSQPAVNKPQLGDLGINAVKLKAPKKLKEWLSKIEGNGGKILEQNELEAFVQDPYGNTFYIEPSTEWHENGDGNGGVAGAIIGVSDIEKSKAFYAQVLGFTIIEETDDIILEHPVKKVTLSYTVHEGAFSPLLGSFTIDLIERVNYTPNKIYENRFWGDLGFIHLCLDTNNLSGLKEHAQNCGCDFTVDSGESFAMEDAAGRFAYIEDPDGALLELVETHKVPLIKKLGFYLKIKGKTKPLANWKLNLLKLKRKK